MAWPYNPAEIAATATPGIASAIRSGQSLVDTAKAMGSGALVQGKNLASFANKTIAPAGGAILRAAGAIGTSVRSRPMLAKSLLGGAILAPIVGDSFMEHESRDENKLMSARLNPERDVTANLDEFLEKKAGYYPLGPPKGSLPYAAVGPSDFAHQFGIGAASSGAGLGGEFAKGIGSSLANGVIKLLGHAFDAVNSAMISKPKQKAIFDSAIRTDPTIVDFLQGAPEHMAMLTDAYATLSRFAPSLSEDINVVRTYLREVALSGGGVNYATVKNLIDTERALKGFEGAI